MGMNFAKAASLYALAIDTGTGSESGMVDPQPNDRPTIPQPDVQTDGLDPAALGGPAPFNSGQGPYGKPVADDPLLADPIRPGAPVPHLQGPDLDTTTLH